MKKKTKIVFNNEKHSYKDGKVQYSSVSKLISKYKQPYDREFWSIWGACKEYLGPDGIREVRKKLQTELYGVYYPKDNRIFQEKVLLKKELLKAIPPKDRAILKNSTKVILKDWDKKRDDSIKKGNDYHEYQELKAISDGFMYNPHTDTVFTTIKSVKIYKKDGVEYRENLYSLEELPDGFHPELILWNDQYGLAGQTDKCFIETIDNVRFIDIDDFKTNNKIDTTSIFGNMLPPLEHLVDCNYNHYRLQISTYAWMLEQAGYTVRSVRFSHLNKPYVFEYMRDEVEAMLDIKKDFSYL